MTRSSLQSPNQAFAAHGEVLRVDADPLIEEGQQELVLGLGVVLRTQSTGSIAIVNDSPFEDPAVRSRWPGAGN